MGLCRDIVVEEPGFAAFVVAVIAIGVFGVTYNIQQNSKASLFEWDNAVLLQKTAKAIARSQRDQELLLHHQANATYPISGSGASLVGPTPTSLSSAPSTTTSPTAPKHHAFLGVSRLLWIILLLLIYLLAIWLIWRHENKKTHESVVPNASTSHHPAPKDEAPTSPRFFRKPPRSRKRLVNKPSSDQPPATKDEASASPDFTNPSPPDEHDALQAISDQPTTPKDEAPASPISLTSSPPSHQPIATQASLDHELAAEDEAKASPSGISSPASINSHEISTRTDTPLPDESFTISTSSGREVSPQTDASPSLDPIITPLPSTPPTVVDTPTLVDPVIQQTSEVIDEEASSEGLTGDRVTHPGVQSPVSDEEPTVSNTTSDATGAEGSDEDGNKDGSTNTEASSNKRNKLALSPEEAEEERKRRSRNNSQRKKQRTALKKRGLFQPGMTDASGKPLPSSGNQLFQ